MEYAREEGKTEVPNDPKARELLERAFNKTSRWPEGYGGFEADLSINVNGEVSTGKVTVKSSKEVEVTLPSEDLQKWAQGQISMIATHRGPRNFEESDGKYNLSFAGEENHPQGPRISLGDSMGSTYRVKNDRITQINRKMPYVAFTINVEDSALTSDDKYLTTRYSVYYFSPKDGSLANVESFSDTHVRAGNADLPSTRRIISYEKGEMVTRTMTFENHKPL
jgi:type 1 fimbria pilin